MTERNHLVSVYLTSEEKAQLKEWAQETGKSQSELARDAILEYCDHDRFARVEERLDELAESLEKSTTHTHKAEDRMNQSSKSVEKARKMLRRIHENHDECLQSKELDRVIEDYAGADERTKAKYKRIFRTRGLLFEHPGNQKIWTLERDVFEYWIEDYVKLNSIEQARDEIEDYPISLRLGTDEKWYIEYAESESKMGVGE